MRDVESFNANGERVERKKCFEFFDRRYVASFAQAPHDIFMRVLLCHGKGCRVVFCVFACLGNANDFGFGAERLENPFCKFFGREENYASIGEGRGVSAEGGASNRVRARGRALPRIRIRSFRVGIIIN